MAAKVREYLREVRAYLEVLHRESASGLRVIQKNSDLTDRLVRSLFTLAEESVLREGGRDRNLVCASWRQGRIRRVARCASIPTSICTSSTAAN